MTILTPISIIRYFVSGLFAFSIFDCSKKCHLKITFIQSILYSVSLAAFKIFVADSPVITFISAMVIFGCLLLKNKIKIWRPMLVYSFFIACIIEYSHFIIFESVSSIWKCFKLPEATYANYPCLLIFRVIVFILYALIILLIYKLNIINIKSVYKLSNCRIFPAFFVAVVAIVIYLKHHIKSTVSNEFHDVLAVLFVSFIVLTLIFIFSSEIFIDAIETFCKKKTNPAIEEAKLQKDTGYAGLIFESEELNKQMKFFQHELYTIGINTEDKKAKQLIHCNVLINQDKNPEKLNMISEIYLYTGEILGVQPKSVEMNISNLLKNHWNSRDPKILKKIKQNYHGPVSKENGIPTPREFLLYLVKKYRENSFQNKTTNKVRFSFLKKCFFKI